MDRWMTRSAERSSGRDRHRPAEQRGSVMPLLTGFTCNNLFCSSDWRQDRSLRQVSRLHSGCRALFDAVHPLPLTLDLPFLKVTGNIPDNGAFDRVHP